MLHVQTTCSFINAPHDSPLPGGYTPGSDEGSMTLNGLTVLYIGAQSSQSNLEKSQNCDSDMKLIRGLPLIHRGRLLRFDEDRGMLIEFSVHQRSAAKRKIEGKRYYERKLNCSEEDKVATRARNTWVGRSYEIKHIGSHTLQQLKKLSFDEIKVLFEATVKRVNTFTPMKSDDTVPKVVTGSSKRSAEEELGEESSKRQNIREGSEPAEESKDKESDELSQEQLQ
ncbi:hypothetical protein Tco_0382026 [Tanacetum coccineum]